MIEIDFEKQFEYENKFYLSCAVQRIGKFVTHFELFKKATKIAGDIVECGVYKGASLSRFVKFRALFRNCRNKKIIAFDTFGEYPEANYELDKAKREEFIKEGGSKSISKENLIGIYKHLNLFENIELIEGDILDTIANYKVNNPNLKISFLHIDVDLYESTKVCLEELFPLTAAGGIIVLDDYNKFPGATKAIDEFFKGQNILIQRLPYTDSVSFIIK